MTPGVAVVANPRENSALRVLQYVLDRGRRKLDMEGRTFAHKKKAARPTELWPRGQNSKRRAGHEAQAGAQNAEEADPGNRMGRGAEVVEEDGESGPPQAYRGGRLSAACAATAAVPERVDSADSLEMSVPCRVRVAVGDFHEHAHGAGAD
eukprot:g3197.t1